ncbi:hypothetical protein BGZ51_005936 [Haplosporangium sp. Z 767]|nr:hypothetical protein BGZ50_006346 [Haplosporangium sp. Z 11]KAF9180709.1 hypothetical protein BGZ51_005936 [Haplosporangium sp. Z 767]
MLPALESFAMREARELHGKPETLLKNLWSLEDIPDDLLVAIYLNPACASLNMLDLVQLPNKTKLRDKAKALTAKAFISFKEEVRADLQQKNSAARSPDEEDAGEEAGQSNQYSTRYLTLQAIFVVEAYDLQAQKSTPVSWKSLKSTGRSTRWIRRWKS